MTSIKLLEESAEALKKEKCLFAVAGDITLNFYRDPPRAAKNVDLLLLSKNSEELAIQIIKELGLDLIDEGADSSKQSGLLFGASSSTSLVGMQENNPLAARLSFHLCGVKWVTNAVQRAQSNLIDYGFCALPTITPEDLIIAKLFALLELQRCKEIDNIQAIFEGDNDLDFPYLVGQLKKYRLCLPQELEHRVPHSLQRVSREQRVNIEEREIYYSYNSNFNLLFQVFAGG